MKTLIIALACMCFLIIGAAIQEPEPKVPRLVDHDAATITGMMAVQELRNDMKRKADTPGNDIYPDYEITRCTTHGRATLCEYRKLSTD